MQGAREFLSFSRSSYLRFADLTRVHSSGIQWRGRFFAASIPSDSPLPHGKRKRLPKDIRRAMIESFIHKYRASNAGQFPNASLTQKQLGGSFYVIRQILQKLEYENKMTTSGVKKVEAPLVKTRKKENTYFDITRTMQVPSEVDKGMSIFVTDSCVSQEINLKTNDQRPQQIRICDAQVSDQQEVSRNSHSTSLVDSMEEIIPSPKGNEYEEKLQKEEAFDSHFQELEDNRKSLEDKGTPMSETNTIKHTDLEEFQRDASKKTISYDKPTEVESTVWKGLKSFAQSIMNLWSKR